MQVIFAGTMEKSKQSNGVITVDLPYLYSQPQLNTFL